LRGCAGTGAGVVVKTPCLGLLLPLHTRALVAVVAVVVAVAAVVAAVGFFFVAVAGIAAVRAWCPSWGKR